MKVELLGHEAEVGDIQPQQSIPPWHPREVILVWFEFKEAVGSTLSFAIEIEARDYEPEEFMNVIRKEGEEALQRIIKKDKADRVEMEERETRRKTLNKLTADLGDKLDIPYRLETK